VGNGHRDVGEGGRSGRRGGEAEQAGRAGGGGGKGDRVMVPPAEFRSYYGRPVVKAPVWRRDIAGYLFTGGLCAGSALLAAGADLTGRPALRTTGRLTAAGSLLACTYFLINDLGRPKRFLNMLRVAKPTSPMSVGTWIFSGFAVAAGVAAASEVAPWLPRAGAAGVVARAVPTAGRVGGLAAAALAPALGTYTAVLLSNTATPSWHAAHPRLPFVFAGSALASGGAAGLIGAPTAQAGPARTLAVAGAALELTAMHGVEHGMGLVSEPYRQGRAGTWLRAARMLTSAGAVGALLGARSRAVSALAGMALLAGSVCTRFGVFEAGKASAEDPKYTVVPQRERLAARGDA
jgi:hypothetical protein